MKPCLAAALLIALDLVALGALTRAWLEHERLAAPPAAAAPRFDMALLTLPGYDAPELRADPRPLTPDDYPAAIRAHDGAEVTARGYPIVLVQARGVVTEFLLTRFPPGCCFGALPVLDEWIHVTFEAGYPAGPPEQTLAVTGVLELGERVDENGFAESLYRMRASRVER